jgi:hypothetical protein
MKIGRIVAILSLLSSTNCVNHQLFPSYTDHHTISLAILQICHKFFIEKSIKFEVIVFGTTNQHHHYNDVVNQFLQYTNKLPKTNLVKFIENCVDTQPFPVRNPAIVFLLNTEAASCFTKNAVNQDRFGIGHKYLVYVDEELNTVTIRTKFLSDLTYPDGYLYFIVNYQNQFGLYTHEFFTEEHCNEPTLVTLNSFGKKSLRWHSKLMDHTKFQNFHGCELILVELFGIFFNFGHQNQKILNCIRSKDMLRCNHLIYQLSQIEQPQGFLVELFKMISQSSNFTAVIQVEMPEYFKKFYNIVQPYPVVKFRFGSFNSEIGSLTKLYFDSNFLMAATPNEFYSNYEKLLLPFDDVTWTLLLLTFLVAFWVILIMKFAPSVLRDLIFGHEILTPFLNVFHIFFGISQMKLPGASVPRIILILFIIFCLIFRTCYQSMLFEFMTSDMRKPPPKTIDDLVSNNYKIISCDQGHLEQLMKHVNNEETRYVLSA